MVRSAAAAVVCAIAFGGLPGAQPLVDEAVRAPVFAAPVTVAPEAVPAVPPGAGPRRAPRTVAFTDGAFTDRAPDDRAAVAIDAALAQIGLPYVWGGDGPAAGDAGFDCSGLTHFAYAAAGIDLPRTAHTQYYAGPRVPDGAALQPGDLVFYGVPGRVHHVGLYLGDGRMVNAPRFGKPVQVAHHRWPGDAYLGATRPAASGEPGLLPPVPAPIPLPLPVPELFEAPPAPLPDGLELPVQVLAAAPDQAPVASEPSAPASGPVPTDGTGPADLAAAPLPVRPAEPGAQPTDDAAPVRAEPRSSQSRAPSLPARVPAPGAVPTPAPSDSAPSDSAPSDSTTLDPAPPPPEPVSDDPADDGAPATVLSLPGGEVEIGPVAAGPDGLPSAVGVTGGVIRVPAGLLDGLTVGAIVVATVGADPTPLTVRSVELLTAAEALTRTGTVLVAPSDTELWHVIVAT